MVYEALPVLKALLVTVGIIAVFYVAAGLIRWYGFSDECKFKYNLGPIVVIAAGSEIVAIFTLIQYGARMIEGLYPELDPTLPAWPTVVSFGNGALYFCLMLVIGKALEIAIDRAIKKEMNGC